MAAYLEQGGGAGEETKPELPLNLNGKFRIISFNYAGIQLNPFEFMQTTDTKMKECSDKMVEFVKETGWVADAEFSKIDKDWKDQTRFSVCYQPIDTTYLTNNEGTITFSEDNKNKFTEKWMKTAPEGKKIPSICLFDWNCYRAVYSVFTYDEVKTRFDLPATNLTKKRNMIGDFLNRMIGDNEAVVVIQEITNDDVNDLKTYLPEQEWTYTYREKIEKGKLVASTLIITPVVYAANVDNTFPNINGETIAVKTGDNTIIGSHLTSNDKPDKGETQLVQANNFKTELSIRNYLVGIDANGNIEGEGDKNDLITSKKTRSALQAQQNKALVPVEKKIDFILSNLQVLTFFSSMTIFNMVNLSTVPVEMPHPQMPIDHAVRIQFYGGTLKPAADGERKAGKRTHRRRNRKTRRRRSRRGRK